MKSKYKVNIKPLKYYRQKNKKKDKLGKNKKENIIPPSSIYDEIYSEIPVPIKPLIYLTNPNTNPKFC